MLTGLDVKSSMDEVDERRCSDDGNNLQLTGPPKVVGRGQRLFFLFGRTKGGITLPPVEFQRGPKGAHERRGPIAASCRYRVSLYLKRFSRAREERLDASGGGQRIIRAVALQKLTRALEDEISAS